MSDTHLWQALLWHGIEPLNDIVCVSEMETCCLCDRTEILFINGLWLISINADKRYGQTRLPLSRTFSWWQMYCWAGLSKFRCFCSILYGTITQPWFQNEVTFGPQSTVVFSVYTLQHLSDISCFCMSFKNCGCVNTPRQHRGNVVPNLESK